MVLSDIEIANSVQMKPIKEVAEKLGIAEDALSLYGNYKAKISAGQLEALKDKPDGKLILVTAISPTPAGEGKTTTSVGLVDALAAIRAAMDRDGIDAEIVADEWCNTLEDIKAFTEKKAGHMAQIKTPDLGGINNTIEAVLYCKEHGMGAYLGGTCNETNRSAEVCANIAMATKPVQYLAKPGMGVDEGYMIVFNEMSRILALTAE